MSNNDYVDDKNDPMEQDQGSNEAEATPAVESNDSPAVESTPAEESNDKEEDKAEEATKGEEEVDATKEKADEMQVDDEQDKENQDEPTAEGENGTTVNEKEEEKEEEEEEAVPVETEENNGSHEWDQHEHELFLEGVELYGSDNWSLVASWVQTRDAEQVQAYYQSLLEPPEKVTRARPRRRSASRPKPKPAPKKKTTPRKTPVKKKKPAPKPAPKRAPVVKKEVPKKAPVKKKTVTKAPPPGRTSGRTSLTSRRAAEVLKVDLERSRRVANRRSAIAVSSPKVAKTTATASKKASTPTTRKSNTSAKSSSKISNKISKSNTKPSSKSSTKNIKSKSSSSTKNKPTKKEKKNMDPWHLEDPAVSLFHAYHYATLQGERQHKIMMGKRSEDRSGWLVAKLVATVDRLLNLGCALDVLLAVLERLRGDQDFEPFVDQHLLNASRQATAQIQPKKEPKDIWRFATDATVSILHIYHVVSVHGFEMLEKEFQDKLGASKSKSKIAKIQKLVEALDESQEESPEDLGIVCSALEQKRQGKSVYIFSEEIRGTLKTVVREVAAGKNDRDDEEEDEEEENEEEEEEEEDDQDSTASSDDPWAFCHDSSCPLQKVYDTVSQHGTQTLEKEFKKRGASVANARRITKLVDAIDESKRRGFGLAWIISSLERVRGTTSLFSLADEIEDFLLEAEVLISPPKKRPSTSSAKSGSGRKRARK